MRMMNKNIECFNESCQETFKIISEPHLFKLKQFYNNYRFMSNQNKLKMKIQSDFRQAT